MITFGSIIKAIFIAILQCDLICKEKCGKIICEIISDFI